MDKVIDDNYELLIQCLDPDTLAPHLKAHLSVGGSSRYYQAVKNKEMTPREQIEELLRIVRYKDIKFWSEFAAICKKCGFAEVARILYDGIKDAKRRHPVRPPARKPAQYKPVPELEFRGSKAHFQDVLDHNLPALLEMIDPAIIVPALKAHLTVGGNDHYFQKLTLRKLEVVRNEMLLDIIRRRKDMWKPFLDVCQKCGYGDVLEMFKEVRFENQEPKKGKTRSSQRSKTRPGSMPPEPETDSLSSEEDAQTLEGVGLSGDKGALSPNMPTLAIGGAQEPLRGDVTNPTARNVNGNDCASMPKGTPETSEKRATQLVRKEDSEHGMIAVPAVTKSEKTNAASHLDPRQRKGETQGNTDEIVKPELESKEIPTVNYMPHFDEILPTDSSLVSEVNELSDVATDNLFETNKMTNASCHKKEDDSEGTLYCPTIPSSLFEDTPNDKLGNELGYSPAFLRSDCSDTSSDAEKLRGEALRKQEASSQRKNRLGEGDQLLNWEPEEPYNCDRNHTRSKKPEKTQKEAKEDCDVYSGSKHHQEGNDSGASKGSEPTQNDDHPQGTYTLEDDHGGHAGASQRYIDQIRGPTAGSDELGQNQNGGHPEMRTDLGEYDNDESASKTNTDQNGEVTIEPIQHGQVDVNVQGPRASGVYRSLPLFLIEAYTCVDVTRMFSWPIN